MAIYIIVPLEQKDEIAKAINNTLPKEDFYQLKNDSGWLVKYPGTSKELSYKLGIGTENEGTVSSVGSAIVSSLMAYYGYGPTDMWEWVQTRSEGK